MIGSRLCDSLTSLLPAKFLLFEVFKQNFKSRFSRRRSLNAAQPIYAKHDGSESETPVLTIELEIK
jgi:hypothetical protein